MTTRISFHLTAILKSVLAFKGGDILSKSRKPVKANKDKKVFSKTSKTKKELNVAAPMYRGGIRL